MNSARPHLVLYLICLSSVACEKASSNAASETPQTPQGPVYVEPDHDLQAALDLAAIATKDRRLVLKPGIYQTDRIQFCLLAVTAKHEGVVIEGQNGAVLSGRSPNEPATATVSHIVYCGHGLTEKTKLKNITIRGASGQVSRAGVPREDFGDAARILQQGLFFQLDGGALKVFGDSWPSFENVLFESNETRLCGGAVSIEHQGVCGDSVTFRNCRFVGNRCPATGAAVDVLQGSAVRLHNCLFVDNIGNYGMDEVQLQFGLTYNEVHGSGSLTVFPGSSADVENCTFTDNWNGVDDHGTGSRYSRCLFDSNDASDGSRAGHPYEIDILETGAVRNCVFYSEHPDLRNTVSTQDNQFTQNPPGFDEHFVPSAAEYQNVGYRPHIR